MSISKGKLITFEGIDGSGKSTQAKRLVDYLNISKETAIFVREPGGTTISEEIRDILLNRHLEDINDRTEALLMTGSRSQLTHEIIIPNINKGLHVIADRYSDSTLAYQGGGRGLSVQALDSINEFGTYTLKPDLTFFIDISVDVANTRMRVERDRIEKEGDGFQQRVREQYLKLHENEPERVILINGEQSIEDVRTEIWNHVKEKLELWNHLNLIFTHW